MYRLIRAFAVRICPKICFCLVPLSLFNRSNWSGPNCSKLTMSSVNVSLTLWWLNMAYTLLFLLRKVWQALALAKATHFFFSGKNTCELDIVLTRTVNILTSNELVKLTMLWTIGPRSIFRIIDNIDEQRKPYSDCTKLDLYICCSFDIRDLFCHTVSYYMITYPVHQGLLSLSQEKSMSNQGSCLGPRPNEYLPLVNLKYKKCCIQ